MPILRNLEAIDEDDQIKKQVNRLNALKWQNFESPESILKASSEGDKKKSLELNNDLQDYQRSIDELKASMEAFNLAKSERKVNQPVLDNLLTAYKQMLRNYNEMVARVGAFKSKNLFSSGDNQAIRAVLQSTLPDLKFFNQAMAQLGSGAGSNTFARMYNNISGGYLASIGFNIADVQRELAKNNRIELLRGKEGYKVNPKTEEEVEKGLRIQDEKDAIYKKRVLNILLGQIKERDEFIKKNEWNHAAQIQDIIDELLKKEEVKNAIKDNREYLQKILRGKKIIWYPSEDQRVKLQEEYKDKFAKNPSLQRKQQENKINKLKKIEKELRENEQKLMKMEDSDAEIKEEVEKRVMGMEDKDVQTKKEKEEKSKLAKERYERDLERINKIHNERQTPLLQKLEDKKTLIDKVNQKIKDPKTRPVQSAELYQQLEVISNRISELEQQIQEDRQGYENALREIEKAYNEGKYLKDSFNFFEPSDDMGKGGDAGVEESKEGNGKTGGMRQRRRNFFDLSNPPKYRRPLIRNDILPSHFKY